MRIDICNKLSVDHPLQLPMVEPLNVAPADAEGSDEPAGSASATTATSSQTQTQTQTETCEPSNSQPKSPIKQAEPQIALTKIQIIPEYIESASCTEEVKEPEATEMEIDITNSFSTSASDDMTETNIPTKIPTQPINNQPSSSSLAIQPIIPAKPDKIPFPPAMYLDSTLLADVCNNIFQELNRLIQTRYDLFHDQSYEQSWKRLKERTDNVLNALQRTCIDDQDTAQ